VSRGALELRAKFREYSGHRDAGHHLDFSSVRRDALRQQGDEGEFCREQMQQFSPGGLARAVLFSREMAHEVVHRLLQMQACGIAFSRPAGLDWAGMPTGTGRDSVLIVTLREVPPLKIGEGRAPRGDTTWPTLP